MQRQYVTCLFCLHEHATTLSTSAPGARVSFCASLPVGSQQGQHTCLISNYKASSSVVQWSKIKQKKGVNDIRKGVVYSKAFKVREPSEQYLG